jgi:hypothetical protein
MPLAAYRNRITRILLIGSILLEKLLADEVEQPTGPSKHSADEDGCNPVETKGYIIK